MFSDFPNLHPLVVHFPIVLLLLGAALQALLVYKTWPPVKWITLGVMAGGFLGALAASTTFHAEPMGLAPKAATVFAAHEQYAGYTLWLSGITLLLAGIGIFFKLERRAYEILVLVAAVATAGVISVAGHRGAQLVYVEGVGPQGRLLDKGHGHGGGEAMPGTAMEAGGHGEQGSAADHLQNPTPASPGQKSTAKKPSSNDIPSMDLKGQESPKQGSNKATPDQMADMDMSGSKPGGQGKSASRTGTMPNMPALESGRAMPQGLDISAPAKTRKMQGMPGMEGMPGKNKQAAGPKKSTKDKPGMEGMPGMDNMADMPGMKASPPKQPNKAMPPSNMKDMPGMEKGQAMPATGKMPSMSMPANPMDKFRFEDNNPARNKPKTDKQ